MTATFRDVLDAHRPLVLPGAHDALSARLIEHAGFPAFFIGGFPVVGARYGVPDIGLKGLGEIAAAVRDIRAACKLPVVVDADDGYGDVKNVVHTVRTYEDMGVSALMLEDQAWPKRCGHMEGKRVVPTEQAEAKIRAAVAGRRSPDIWIIARTDARSVLGMDEALRRAERYLEAGADGIFIEAPETVEELERAGRAFDAPTFANPLEGGRTPILKPEELHEMGYDVIVYGITLIMRITRTMVDALADIRDGTFARWGTGASFDEYKALVGFDDWSEVEDAHAPTPAE